ncbi:acyltransferase [Gordonia sp. (in: high G+C Gram-positive bacteria)]|uniref:acyltransferase family protein n=1 Tax=Gordonia sp. (in: high G+C Gram-positive bacteria) TaxID=84139 RepID=UPI00260E8353|nr:acyltransferase [Gordonia sp. (in: high G+C Gram-positive bacteria)]
MTTTNTTDPGAPDYRRYFPQLEGMRALAALGVMTTHVAFQTRAIQWPVLGPILGRLDLAVALFFALSGFLLWRRYAAAARHPEIAEPRVAAYLRHRFVRIWPAYAVAVVAVFTLLPQARGASATVWLANLTLTQVFVPLTLAPGLTQMWSLSVEVAFYLLLPVIGYALIAVRGDRARWRIPILAGLGLLSLGWAWVVGALSLPAGVEGKNWVFGHLPWFLAGLILAELTATVELSRPSPLVRRVTTLSANRPLMLVVAVVAYGLACTPLGGPVGLGDLSNRQYVGKIVFGAVAAYAVLAPLVCSAGPFRLLDSGPMTAMGRWSYGIFIWHLAALTCVFGLFGITAFDGHFATVWILTAVLTLGASAASYAFIEDPCRRWLVNWERRRSPSPPRPVPIPD